MSISIPLQIGRMTDIDRDTLRLLRNFDIEWRCGSRLIYMMLSEGLPAAPIAGALTRVMVTYQQMCRDGVCDFNRLRAVLGEVLAALRENQSAPSEQQLLQWCAKANVPQTVREYLTHG